MSGLGRDKVLGVAAAALVVLIVGALAATGYFVSAGTKARRSREASLPAPSEALARPSPRVPGTSAQSTPKPPAPGRSQSGPDRSEPAPEPTQAFDGMPMDWSATRDQQVQFNEPFPAGARLLFVILGADHSVQGTLFLNEAKPALPSNFLLKDESWGQTRHFGGQDILLGVVAVRGTYSDTSLRRAASSAGWWKGKLKPAFQMNY